MRASWSIVHPLCLLFGTTINRRSLKICSTGCTVLRCGAVGAAWNSSDVNELTVRSQNERKLTSRILKFCKGIDHMSEPPCIWPLDSDTLDKSSLPLTDPHDAVPHAHRFVHRCGRSVRQTGNRRLSPVYHTDRRPKLTAPETTDVQFRNF